MNQKRKINLKSIRKYNPGNLEDEDVISNYICRSEVFEKLIKEIASETKNSIPQHHLIVGQRGMGKTTLLKRIEVDIRTHDKLKDKFIPVQYPEEQYNIDRLSKFWFNTLDILVDSIDTKNPKLARKYDAEINTIKKGDDESTLANEAYKLIEELLKEIGKRPVLLIDNIDQLFSLLKETELWDIRQKITDNGAPIFIGASSSSFDEVFSYYQPFYDHFKLTFLNPLNEIQFTNLIITLSDHIENEEIRNEFHKNRTRIKSLFRLTGGNIRTAIILFSSLSNGFGKSISDDLDELLDEMTPIYKARIEELSNQLKAIVDEIALEHNPIDLIALRERTKMSNNTLSPQVKRLRQMGWITTEDAIKGRGNYYEITERFFNVWYLMRRSTRRNKKNISALSSFLNEWIDQKETKGKELLSQQIRNSSDISTRLALSELLPDGELKESLKEHAKDGVYKLSKKDLSILNEFSEFKEEGKHNKESEDWEVSYDLLLIEKKYNEAEILITSQLPYINDNRKIHTLFKLGTLYHEYLANYIAAEETYKKILLIDANQVEVLNELGILYQLNLNDYTKAEETYKRGLAFSPNNSNILNNLGNLCHEKLHRYDEAEQLYKKAITIDPDNLNFIYNLSILYIAHFSKYLESEKLLKKVLEKDNSNNDDVWNTLGYLYQYHLEKHDEAQVAYERSISINSRHYLAWNNLGNLFTNYRKNYKKAEIAYKNAIKINKDYSHPWNGLGELYQDHLNDPNKALEYYKKGIELDPNEMTTRFNLIFLLRDVLGKNNMAKKYLPQNVTLEFQDTFFIHKSIFNVYDENFGLAKEDLIKAIGKLENTPPEATILDWTRFAAIAIDKGFGTIMIEQFQAHGIDIIMRPYYEACVALHSGGEDHIHRQAAEVRDTAFEIYEYMKKYRGRLYGKQKHK